MNRLTSNAEKGNFMTRLTSELTDRVWKLKAARLKSIFVEEREYEGLRDQNKRLELTDRVLRKAWKRKLAAPGRSESEFWQNEFGTPVGARILTWKGIELMSERIREDKKARREVWIGRIKILAYVVGIVGGLWAFLERLL